MSETTEVRHDNAGVYTTGSHGSWSACTCGWRSSVFTSAVGASIQYARHIAEVTQR